VAVFFFAKKNQNQNQNQTKPCLSNFFKSLFSFLLALFLR
jgi:hypothetical protein